jgi:hypothetical protein
MGTCGVERHRVPGERRSEGAGVGIAAGILVAVVEAAVLFVDETEAQGQVGQLQYTRWASL